MLHAARTPSLYDTFQLKKMFSAGSKNFSSLKRIILLAEDKNKNNPVSVKSTCEQQTHLSTSKAKIFEALHYHLLCLA